MLPAWSRFKLSHRIFSTKFNEVRRATTRQLLHTCQTRTFLQTIVKLKKSILVQSYLAQLCHCCNRPVTKTDSMSSKSQTKTTSYFHAVKRASKKGPFVASQSVFTWQYLSKNFEDEADNPSSHAGINLSIFHENLVGSKTTTTSIYQWKWLERGRHVLGDQDHALQWR